MSERVAAIRDNGVVVNVIIYTDDTAEQLAQEGISDFEEITDLVPRPSVGWLWDETNGYRWPSQFPSWVWNGDDWEAPVAVPTEGGPYTWNEEAQEWEAIPIEDTSAN